MWILRDVVAPVDVVVVRISKVEAVTFLVDVRLFGNIKPVDVNQYTSHAQTLSFSLSYATMET